MNKEVHLSSWSQQPDVQIDCTGDYGTPAWGAKEKLAPGVYLLSDGRLYTFDLDSVTCERCLEIGGKALRKRMADKVYAQLALKR